MSKKLSLFGIDIDAVSKEEAVRIIIGWVKSNEGLCRYVVTPNTDHIVKLRKSGPFLQTYRDASLVLTDGMPVLLAAKALGQKIPEIVPGSDLVVELFDAAASCGGFSVYLLGAGPGVAERAFSKIREKWPTVREAGFYSPPFGFEKDETEVNAILERIAAAEPDLLVVGLGAPKQELWVHTYRHRLKVKVALCAGASIDFVAGERPRAPRWVRAVAMEWMFRMLSEPRRLAKRYIHDALVFPLIIFNEVRLKRMRAKSAGR
jgi:N-acetylglucosaminyldiphosphoundecaprenol N-acetyl-beta-D-mannosaminyltransferase